MNWHESKHQRQRRIEAKRLSHQQRRQDESQDQRQARLEYVVDSWAKIEFGYNTIQKSLRADKYCGLIDAIGDGYSNNAGRRVILPPTIYGSPRFYNEQFKSSMTVVRHYGKPDYFITFTTNPQWKGSGMHSSQERSQETGRICAPVSSSLNATRSWMTSSSESTWARLGLILAQSNGKKRTHSCPHPANHGRQG